MLGLLIYIMSDLKTVGRKLQMTALFKLIKVNVDSEEPQTDKARWKGRQLGVKSSISQSQTEQTVLSTSIGLEFPDEYRKQTFQWQ